MIFLENTVKSANICPWELNYASKLCILIITVQSQSI
jgi:hypothetical protein